MIAANMLFPALFIEPNHQDPRRNEQRTLLCDPGRPMHWRTLVGALVADDTGSYQSVFPF
jgi:hypothetical protein